MPLISSISCLSTKTSCAALILPCFPFYKQYNAKALHRIKHLFRREDNTVRIFVITKRMLIIAAVAVLAVAAALIIAVAFSDSSATAAGGTVQEEYELTVLARAKRELPIYSVKRDDKKIALTIDAAWEDDKTEFILDTLEKYNIKATFFLCGFWVEKYPEQVKAIRAAGHEIGNHTATHPHMTKLSKKEMCRELEDFEKLMEKTIGERTKIFRAPYGEYDDNVIKAVRELGYEVIQWDIDTVDIKWNDSEGRYRILHNVLLL